MKNLTLTLLLTLVSSLAFAGNSAPQPSPVTNYQHPAPSATADVLMQGKDRSAQLKNEGKVLSNIKTAGYSYLEVQQGQQKRWLAVMQNDIKPGTVIRYEDGMEMKNFYSKTLQRNFPSVYFVGRMAVVPPKKK